MTKLLLKTIVPLGAAVVLFSAFSGVLGQTPRPTPTPDDRPPVQPTFSVPQRPLPDATRVGVVAGTELSLSLDDAIEMALKNNNDIGVSRAGTKTSNLDLLGVKGAYDPLVASTNFYESVSVPTASAIGGAVNGSVTTTRTSNNISIDGLVPLGGASYSAVFNSSRNTTSNTNSFLNPQFPSSLNFSYTQPLRRNRSIDAARRNIQIAKKNIEISETQLQTEAMNVVNTVEQAYWDLVYAMRSIEVQTDTLKQARAQLESNSRMVEKGVLAPIEIVAARAQIATFEQNVYEAQESATRAENTLKTLILAERSAPEWDRPITPVTPTAVAVPQIGLEIAKIEAFRKRPEIAEFQLRQDQNLIDQRFYKDQKKMQIDLVGSYTTQGLGGTQTPAAINPATGLSRVPPNLVGGYFTSLRNLLGQEYPTYRASLVFSFPLGNRAARANYGKTLVAADSLEKQRAAREQTVEAEVRNALQSLRSTEARLSAATSAREAAEELYNSEERLFRGGTSTFYLVSQRLQDLVVARGRELAARTDLNKAIAGFNRATGTILEVHNVTVGK
ncbi:MAG TPA: TolC family protein [Pyrinomonadaceae bacterium]|nr:TolC family protein [Pyrinomonadaceae bacterium]